MHVKVLAKMIILTHYHDLTHNTGPLCYPVMVLSCVMVLANVMILTRFMAFARVMVLTLIMVLPRVMVLSMLWC